MEAEVPRCSGRRIRRPPERARSRSSHGSYETGALPTSTSLTTRRLHAWSVDDLEGFWAAAADFLGVRFHAVPQATLASLTMPGTDWFPGATLNYAEHALTEGPGRAGDDLAVVFVREDGLERLVNHRELRELVGRVRAGLLRLGVGRGDRVVALHAKLRGGAGRIPGSSEPRRDLVVVLT